VQTHKNGQDNFLLPLSGANWFTYDVNVDMVSFQFFFFSICIFASFFGPWAAASISMV